MMLVPAGTIAPGCAATAAPRATHEQAVSAWPLAAALEAAPAAPPEAAAFGVGGTPPGFPSALWTLAPPAAAFGSPPSAASAEAVAAAPAAAVPEGGRTPAGVTASLPAVTEPGKQPALAAPLPAAAAPAAAAAAGAVEMAAPVEGPPPAAAYAAAGSEPLRLPTVMEALRAIPATATAAPGPAAAPAVEPAPGLPLVAAGPQAQPPAVMIGSASSGNAAAGGAVAAASASAAPASVQRQVQIALGGQLRLHDGAQRLELRLDPPHLGRVEVLLVREGDHLQVTFRADSPAAQQALRQGADELAASLLGRGPWQDVQVKVEERPREHEPGGGRQRGDERQPRERGREGRQEQGS